MAAKPLPRLPDGTVDTSGDLGNHFDEILDELHANPSLHRSDFELSPDEIAQMERQEAYFWAALQKEVNSRLSPEGLRILRTFPDPAEGRDYIIHYRDCDGRPLECRVSVGECLALGEQYGEEMGRHIINLVTEKMRDARSHYFSRMS